MPSEKERKTAEVYSPHVGEKDRSTYITYHLDLFLIYIRSEY